MIPRWLVPHVDHFEFGHDRPKSHGCMWGGSADAIINGNKYQMKLWYHGGDEENCETLLPQLCLESVTVNGKFYDAYWYVLWDHKSLWLHPEGWFRDSILRDKIPHGNPNLDERMLPVDELLQLGFKRIIC